MHAPNPSPEMIEAGETALIEYEYASRKYDDYSHKAAAEAVIAAALVEARAAVAELIDKVDSALTLGWSDTAARELRAALARVTP